MDVTNKTGLVDLAALEIWQDNYNKGDVDGIARSIRRFGFNGSPRVWRGNQVRANNHTVLALRQIKRDGPDPKLDKQYPPQNVIVDGETWYIPFVDISHLDELEANAFAIADNQHARNAAQDDALLFKYLQDIAADPIMFGAVGIEDKLFEQLRLMAEEAIPDMDGGEATAGTGDEEDEPLSLVEEYQAKWGVEPGDVWLIPSNNGAGVHRLMCGDCRDVEHVQKLCTQPVQMAFTSPPYAERRKEHYNSIAPDEYVDWWDGVQAATRAVLVDGGSFFVNIKPHTEEGERHLYVFDMVLAMKRRWAWRFVDEFCWQRPGVPGAWKDRFKNGFEPVYQFAAAGDDWKFHPERVGDLSDQVMVNASKVGAVESSGTGTFYNTSGAVESGLAIPDNVVKVSRVEPKVGHPAMFPVGLPEHFIKVYSDVGDAVYDPFMGGGSSFMAAEQTGRIAYGMEIKPAYCAAILERLSRNGLVPERAN